MLVFQYAVSGVLLLMVVTCRSAKTGCDRRCLRVGLSTHRGPPGRGVPARAAPERRCEALRADGRRHSGQSRSPVAPRTGGVRDRAGGRSSPCGRASQRTENDRRLHPAVSGRCRLSDRQWLVQEDPSLGRCIPRRVGGDRGLSRPVVDRLVGSERKERSSACLRRIDRSAGTIRGRIAGVRDRDDRLVAARTAAPSSPPPAALHILVWAPADSTLSRVRLPFAVSRVATEPLPLEALAGVGIRALARSWTRNAAATS